MAKDARKGIDMANGSLLLLGTGASAGIPVMGCSCAVCLSTDEKNKRSRASAFIRYKHRAVLIDAGPDIRQQSLKFGIKHVDGLILTHTHYDHIGGLEELRAFTFSQKAPIPCLLSEISLTHIKKLFYYLFEEHSVDKTVPAKFVFQQFNDKRGVVNFCDIPIHYFTYSQPHMEVTGYRLGDLAYITDIKDYPENIFEDLKDLNTLIISALRHTYTKLQFSVDEAVAFAKKVGAKTTYLIHMSHELEHTNLEKHLEKYLPLSIKPGFDGLEIAFTMD